MHNETTGNFLSWNPNANNTVLSIAVSGTTIYVGGEFDTIGKGIGHPYFARFDDLNPTSVIRPSSPKSGLNNIDLQKTTFITSHSPSGAFVKLSYILPKPTTVSLRLYSLNGQLQSELVNKNQEAGSHFMSMQRGKLAAGLYLVDFKAGDVHQERIVSLMK
ncbi:MAG: hypothetical protein PHC61_01900 [Chitinivibrionales bacterium]|nr:hypothetical protein [Chitinivibrionales bacterium]